MLNEFQSFPIIISITNDVSTLDVYNINLSIKSHKDFYNNIYSLIQYNNNIYTSKYLNLNLSLFCDKFFNIKQTKNINYER